MFSLFSGKISGVFTLLAQGISQAVGFITKAVISVVDDVVDLVSELTAPITEKLTVLPVLGETVSAVLDVTTDLLGNVSNGVHAIADELLTGNLFGGVTTALNGTTDVVGSGLNGVSDILDSVLSMTAPLTAPLTALPVLGDVVAAIGQTTSNLSGFIAEIGDYVVSVQQLDLVTGLLSNPVASIGGVVQDVSDTLDSLLDDLAPITTTVTALPVVGDIVATVGSAVDSVNDGLYDLGTQLTQFKAFDLELSLPLQFG